MAFAFHFLVIRIVIRVHHYQNTPFHFILFLALKCTLMSPSAEPVTKYSSSGSMARHLIGTSCAWKVCLSCRWRMSNIQTSPFLPPEIRSWWWGAYTMAGHPCSWQMKAANKWTYQTILVWLTQISSWLFDTMENTNWNHFLIHNYSANFTEKWPR